MGICLGFCLIFGAGCAGSTKPVLRHFERPPTPVVDARVEPETGVVTVPLLQWEGLIQWMVDMDGIVILYEKQVEVANGR